MRAAKYTAGALALALPAALWAGPLGLPDAPPATEETRLTVTWYGVATILFDDGDTQILIDGFFSRPSRTNPFAVPDLDQIKRQLDRIGLHELAAVTPVHSHFDHAMDVGAIAKLTGAAARLGFHREHRPRRGCAGRPDQDARRR